MYMEIQKIQSKEQRWNETRITKVERDYEFDLLPIILFPTFLQSFSEYRFY